MNCTLHPDALPKVPVAESKTDRKQSTTSISVFDVDLKEWRSFRIKNVRQIQFDLLGHPFPTGPKP
jgi:hypothetical protein